MGNLPGAINERISDINDEILSNPDLSPNERRELNGIIAEETNANWTSDDISIKLDAYKTEAVHWETEAAKEPKGARKATFKLAARISRLLGDRLRLQTGRRLETEEGIAILREESENNDLTRFERFKVWAKKNLGTISVVAISVAGIVTSIVMSFRKAVVRGARATGKFAKALASVAAKVGPVVGAVLNLIGMILGLGAREILWISQNLWILVVLIAYWLMERYKRNRNRNRRHQ